MKRSHKDVNYRTGTGDRKCGLCTMFVPPRSCTAVEDPISSQGLCDLFVRRRVKAGKNHKTHRK